MEQIRSIVVIVEDEIGIATSLSRIIESRGYNAKIATSPALAVDIVKESANEIAFVILDIILADSSGVDVAKKILDIKKDTKIIVSTAADDYVSYKELMSLGVKAFLKKPYEVSTLDDALREMS